MTVAAAMLRPLCDACVKAGLIGVINCAANIAINTTPEMECVVCERFFAWEKFVLLIGIANRCRCFEKNDLVCFVSSGIYATCTNVLGGPAYLQTLRCSGVWGVRLIALLRVCRNLRHTFFLSVGTYVTVFFFQSVELSSRPTALACAFPLHCTADEKEKDTECLNETVLKVQ